MESDENNSRENEFIIVREGYGGGREVERGGEGSLILTAHRLAPKETRNELNVINVVNDASLEVRVAPNFCPNDFHRTSSTRHETRGGDGKAGMNDVNKKSTKLAEK